MSRNQFLNRKTSLDDLQLFQFVVQQGSLRAASAKAGIPIATLSRRLQKLERSLGSRLLERSAHHFALTDMGQRYFTACGPLLDDLTSVTEQIEGSRKALAGPLRITAPVNLTQQWLGQCFHDFIRRYPDIRLHLQVSNHYENLVEQQIDAAIRVGDSQHSPNWIARQVWQTQLALCASPQYLQRAPALQHPRDLARHQLVVATPMSHWDLTHKLSGERYGIAPQPYFECSDIQVALDAVDAGFGIVQVPDYYFLAPREHWRNLVQVLPDWYGQPRPIHLLYRDRAVMSARLRAFVDHVVEWMQRRRDTLPVR